MKVYLDYNATTPIDKQVADEMQPYLYEHFGNPSSTHWLGIETKKAVENSREQIAKLLNCSIDEIIFTSGGTESNNYAIKGIAYSLQKKGNHIITSQIEHPAVIEVCKYLENNGYRVSYISVDSDGIIHLDKLKEAITDETILISVMHANNETGSIQPIQEISQIAKSRNIVFHTDAAQSLGKVKVDVKDLGIDLLSIAGHKLYAPKGIGAIYVKRGLELKKLIHGADHERNFRAGTENVLEIVGLGKACELAGLNLEERANKMKKTRDRLQENILNKFPQSKINGHLEKRLPNTLNISFPGIEANLLLSELELKGIAASAGAACHSESITVSPVLEAMKIPVDISMGTIRFSTGKSTSEEEIDYASEKIIDALNTFYQEKNTPIEISSKVRLTQYTQGLGCACKMRPQMLEKILLQVPKLTDKNAIIGVDASDDAAVYKINDTQLIVQTVDFFTPIVDDPYEFGAIAAANSISDIYAMGAKPLFALNIVGFPTNRLSEDVLSDILRGAHDKAKEAGISILGGHTIDDVEPKFGMAVTGIVENGKLITNSNAKPGDVLILTKPIGTGIIATALKKNIIDRSQAGQAIDCMSALNDKAAECMKKYTVDTCTDVTGFGLLGHLREITKASKVEAEISLKEVPILEHTWDLIVKHQVVPGGTKQNLDYIRDDVQWDAEISEHDKYILADAQTSGGLLICCPKNEAKDLLEDLKKAGITDSTIIGSIDKKGNGLIKVIK